MVFGLGKLFGKKDGAAPPPEPAKATAPAAASDHPVSAFIRRDAVFDRDRKLVGHLFRLQHLDAGLGDAPTERQKLLDDTLLRALCASSEGWGNNLAFLPLGSESLDNPQLDALPAAHTVLLLFLSPETTDLTRLADRLAALNQRGLKIGVFRQPKHPAFSTVLIFAEFAAIDVAQSQGGNIRDYSVALRSDEVRHPVVLLATNIESIDDHQICHQWNFRLFHGPFASRENRPPQPKSDPHKLHLLHLFNLVQSDADTAKVADALKQDPMLTFRILRYLNSAAVGLSRPLASIDQALVMIGRQRLARWLSVLLFSVREPDFAEWLLVESALGRGRIMELLGAERFPAAEADHLFLTGVFSRLDRLLRIPLVEAIDQIPLPANVRNALLERSGPYAPLLAVAEACEAPGGDAVTAAAGSAGLVPDKVNHALISATTWANEITEHWE